MAEPRLTGTRIRDRRLLQGMRQAELARRAGISASYLNLIEHNRRRIAGSLLGRIAEALGLDPAALSEGAEGTRLDELRAAASQLGDGEAELDRAEEFLGRFPGWAGLAAAQSRRIAGLEGQVRALTDRLAYDPELARSLHEVISSVTSIRSTSAILTGGGDLDADWRDRFLGNIREDAQRLAENSRSLAAYLEAPLEEAAGAGRSPLEEADAMFEAAGHHFPLLEADPTEAGVAQVLEAEAGRLGDGARALAETRLARLAEDIRALPLEHFGPAALETGHDPAALAERFDAPLDRVLRRLATLPPGEGHPQAGLAICDAAGVITTVKPVSDLALPRSGAACPYWPLFEALGQPGRPLRAEVAVPGRAERHFRCYAVALPRGAPEFDGPQRLEATMLLWPRPADPETPAPRLAGLSCRICPREACPARREPSILSGSV